MPAPAAGRGLQPPAGLRQRAAVQRPAVDAPRARPRSRAQPGALGLALIAMAYVLYLPVGPALIYNDLVYGPGALSVTLPKIWSIGRYVAALAVAPTLLIAGGGGRPFMRCWPLFPFAIFAAASTLWSLFPQESMRESLDLFSVMVIAATLTRWYGLSGFGRGVQIVTGVLMIASLLTALLLPKIGVHHAYDLVEPGHAGKWRGLFLHKNMLGQVSVMAIVFSLRSVRHETTAWKGFFFLARACAFACCIMAGSASALGGALIALAFFFLMKNRATANPWVIVTTTLIGGALVQMLSLSPGRLAGWLGRDSTFSGRTEIWALGRSMIERRLFFGSGLGTDGAVFGEVARNNLFSSAVDLHSGYLDILFNLGLIGAALMAVAVFVAMLRAYAFTQSFSGQESAQAVIFMTLVVSACAIAAAEVSPFKLVGGGAVALWMALPALYQLGSTHRLTRRPKASGRAASHRLAA
jgi:O-antigen ligase